mgnify:CR=1 FL=1
MGYTHNERRHRPRCSIRDCYVAYRQRGFKKLFRRRKKPTHSLPAIDLSESGAKFLAKRKESVGQRLELYLDAPAFSEELKVSAVVRWCEKVPRSDVYRIGVEFRGTSPRFLRHIKCLVNDHPLLRCIKRQPDR